jgi:hypothetical protein
MIRTPNMKQVSFLTSFRNLLVQMGACRSGTFTSLRIRAWCRNSFLVEVAGWASSFLATLSLKNWSLTVRKGFLVTVTGPSMRLSGLA